MLNLNSHCVLQKRGDDQKEQGNDGLEEQRCKNGKLTRTGTKRNEVELVSCTDCVAKTPCESSQNELDGIALVKMRGLS